MQGWPGSGRAQGPTWACSDLSLGSVQLGQAGPISAQHRGGIRAQAGRETESRLLLGPEGREWGFLGGTTLAPSPPPCEESDWVVGS